MHLIYNYRRKSVDEFMGDKQTHDSEQRSTIMMNQSKGTQTDYRESETQTIPWEPPFKLSINNNKSQVLNLTSLRWNDGLPLGMDEINTVKKMRIIKAWESVLPPLDCKVNVQTHNAIIAMIDKDKWASRDKELQLVMDTRMEWMNEMIKQNNIEEKKKGMERLEKLGKQLNQMRNKEMLKIKRELSRKLRKLNSKYRDANTKVILEPIYNKKSMEMKKDFYIIKLKLADESLESVKQFYDSLLSKKCDDNYKQTDVANDCIPKISHMTVTKRGNKQPGELCIRETKWTHEKLQNLHEDLKNIRLNVSMKR